MEETYTVHLHVSGFPGVSDRTGFTPDTLSFGVLVNGVQVLDTTFVPTLNLTEHVHTRLIHVTRGSHVFQVVDRRASTVQRARLRARAEPMWVSVRFTDEGTTISTGYGFMEFL